MRASALVILFGGAALARASIMRRACSHDNCLRAFLGEGSPAVSYCASYTVGEAIPTWANNCDGDVGRIQSACACIYTAVSTTTSSTTTPSTTSTPTTTTYSSSPTTTTQVSSTTTAPTTTIPTMTTTVGPVCHCTAWSQIAAAESSCTDITLDNIVVPTRSGIPLTKLAVGATVTFVGNTSFQFSPYSGYKMVTISGNNVTIKGAPGSFFDGGGPMYWDGLGNGGSAKPGNFMKVSLTNNSLMTDLYVLNTPTHAIDVDGVYNSTIQNIVVDNSAGDAPNAISGGKSAAHNTDGFDVGNVENILMQNCTVYGQDDCVALSVSNNVVIRDFFCSGTHGLSIAGGGSGPGQNVTNVLFTDSVMTNSTYGLRIKTDYNSTGSVVNVTYSNIYMYDIHTQGIDVEQDYLNGGPYGTPSNGVEIRNLTFSNITGSVDSTAMDYYVLCGDGSCDDFHFIDVDVTGGEKASSCNYPPTGCPGP